MDFDDNKKVCAQWIIRAYYSAKFVRKEAIKIEKMGWISTEGNDSVEKFKSFFLEYFLFVDCK